MIREEIRKKEVQIIAALLHGAPLQSGPHVAAIDSRKRLHVYAFRGTILRHSD